MIPFAYDPDALIPYTPAAGLMLMLFMLSIVAATVVFTPLKLEMLIVNPPFVAAFAILLCHAFVSATAGEHADLLQV